MREIFLLFLTLLFIFNQFSYGEDKKKTKSSPVLLSIVKGSITDFLPKGLIIKDVFYQSASYFAGELFILSKYDGDFTKFYIKNEKKIINDFINVAKKNCAKDGFFALDNLDINVIPTKSGLLLVATTNIVCIDVKF